MSAALLTVGVLFAVPLAGAGSLLAARISQGSLWQPFGQRLFYLGFSIVGAATVVAACLGTGYWPICGMTMGVMVVGVTLDGGSGRPDAI